MTQKQQKTRMINADFILSRLSDEKLAEMSVMVDFLLEDPENKELLESLLDDTDIIIAEFQNRRPLTGFHTRATFARVKAPIPVRRAALDGRSIGISFESSEFKMKEFEMNLDFRLRLLSCLDAEAVHEVVYTNQDKMVTKLFVQNITDDGSREDIYSVNFYITKNALLTIAADATDGSKESISAFFHDVLS